MKIVRIFEDQLFGLVCEPEEFDELSRLLNLWSNVAFLYDYARSHGVADVRSFTMSVLLHLEQIQNRIERIRTKQEPMDYFFQPLSLIEHNRVLGLVKGKTMHNPLRIYGIKVDDDCFLITGGAIKMSQTMQGHPDTMNELLKMTRVRDFLIQEGVLDASSLNDLLFELL
jgi:hypothetical protein